MAAIPIKAPDGPVESVEQVFPDGNPIDAWRIIAARAFPDADFDEGKVKVARDYCGSPSHD